MKTIIAGSRSIKTLKTVEKAIEESGFEITKVISGGASGVDSLAETWAEMNDIPCQVFEANWSNLKAPGAVVKTNRYGKYNARAGLDRNKKMAEVGEALIAIWNGVSSGTANMILTAHKYNLKVYVKIINEKTL